MKKLCFFVMLCLLGSVVLAETIPAAVSCRTRSGTGGDYSYADTNNTNSEKLTVRAGDQLTDRGEKSWIKFNLGDLPVSSLNSATLKIYLQATKTGSADLSAVNDDHLDNIGWGETDITWNNAPGNDTVSFAAVDPTETTFVERFNYDGPAGTEVVLDVLSILQADTDGIVQFILHNSTGDTNFCTHDHPTAAWRPVLEVSTPEGAPPIGAEVAIQAFQSCRTENGDNSDALMSDANKLSVRSSAPGAKSWIKFDLAGVDVSTLRSATLTVTLFEAEGGTQTCAVSAVNDDCTENLYWTDDTLTWNTAPGNLTTDLALLDSTETTSVGTLNITDAAAGDSFSIDVLPIVQADTDNFVQFVLHNSSTLQNFTTHDHAANPSWRPVLTLVVPPAGADYPNPYPGQVVGTDLAALLWANPDPNEEGGVITCDVYLGTEPNRPEMDKVALTEEDIESVLINATNFEHFAPLQDMTTYYWAVDCYDSSLAEPLIPGLMWYFVVNDNTAPVVNAGLDQTTWGLPKVINLDGTVTDDGLPNPPGSYTIEWTQTGGPGSVDPNDQVDTSVTITEAGDYEFTLTADDGDKQTSDTVRIVVGEDACDASHLLLGNDYDPGDFNEDCMVDMLDFAELISRNWMICTDELTNCGL